MNLTQKILALFNDKESSQDIKELSKLSFVERQMRRQWNETKSLNDNKVREERIWDNISNKSAKRNILFLNFIKKAAIIILFLSIGYTAHYILYNKNTSGSEIVEVYSDGDMKYLLPDNTTIWLQNKSKLRFNKKDFKKNREIWFEGKSVFEVTKAKNSFRIHLNKASIQVLGTKFSVNSTNKSDITEINLFEGKICFKTKNNKNLIHAGERVIYNKKASTIQIKKDLNTTWHNGTFSFKKIQISELIKRLEYTFNTKIVLDKKINPRQKITGSIDYNENIDEIIYKICYILKATYTKENNIIYINKNIN